VIRARPSPARLVVRTPRRTTDESGGSSGSGADQEPADTEPVTVDFKEGGNTLPKCIDWLRATFKR
jgi:hypothetical protein